MSRVPGTPKPSVLDSASGMERLGAVALLTLENVAHGMNRAVRNVSMRLDLPGYGDVIIDALYCEDCDQPHVLVYPEGEPESGEALELDRKKLRAILRETRPSPGGGMGVES